MYDQFETDPKAEEDGIWVDYGQFRVRVAYAGGSNKSYQKTMARLAKPYQRAIATDSLPADVAEKLLIKAYAKSVIRAWESKVDGKHQPGIEAQDGSLLPFNEENVSKTLEALPNLFEDLRAQASSWALFRSSMREEASGN